MRQSTDKPAIPDAVAEPALVERLLAGDGDAADALVQRHTRPLLAYLGRLAGDATVAEELHQVTWLSALEHLGQFRPQPGLDPTGGFKPWLFRIATNKAHDHFRRNGRQRERYDRLAADPSYRPGAATDGDAAAFLDRQEQGQRLREAIDALPGPQRDVVLLRFYGGLKFIEIAETVGCPLNTALGRMHKAIAKLRVHFGDDLASLEPSGRNSSARAAV